MAGCAQSGTPVAGEIDVRTLDSSSYPVNRYTYDRNANGGGTVLEGMRMADAVVPTVRAEPSLKVGRGGIVLKSVDEVIDVSHLSSTAKPILQNRGFIVGFATSGADKPDVGEDKVDPTATTMTIRLLRFPSEDAAKLAAREIADADFNVALDQNRKLTLAEYPDALIHWRPTVPTIGVAMPRKEFVISMFIVRTKPDQTELMSLVKKGLDAEVPAVDAFRATPADAIAKLPFDPDRMLARTLVDSRDDSTPDPDKFGYFGPNMLVHAANDQGVRQRLVDSTGMDQMANAGDGYLFRTRDAKAGNELVSGLIAILEGVENGSAPSGVPDSKCVHNSKGTAYRCWVVYKRYVGVVNADNEADAHKLATAQYALLANSL
ncbi:hypothetical protein H0264_11610 [Nocardia huaxiensis]|uniref:Uncharacterized protein n=1 Tax=Nocardia huaxiensis TaxID=2755382 RepID=A0A7D6ZID0_9NOCA|nr:hypothetical protein H0264_11610 [Nocardia huaxiensis]